MDMATLNQYLSNYGMLFLFIIFFLEYLNLPGLAAGIIMPLAGIWAKTYNESLILAIFISVVAGLLASFILYLLGRFGGKYILSKYINRFPKQGKFINKQMDGLRKRGPIGVFISKLIPGVRTIISIPAGALRINVFKYSLWATLGIIVYNTAFISAGYFLGNSVFAYLGLA